MDLTGQFTDKVVDPVCVGQNGFAMTSIIREPETVDELTM